MNALTRFLCGEEVPEALLLDDAAPMVCCACECDITDRLAAVVVKKSERTPSVAMHVECAEWVEERYRHSDFLDDFNRR